MRKGVLCLRPEADFARAGALPPSCLDVTYRAPADADVPGLLRLSQALVIPAVGPALPASLFEGTALKLVQVTGAGLDRLDRPALERLGVPVANVPGGSNRAVAEYAVTAAAMLLRRLAWADEEIRLGRYRACRAQIVEDGVSGLDGLQVGVVGFGSIGAAVAEAFSQRGCRIGFTDPVLSNPEAARALGAEAMPLDRLLVSSNVVTLHVPLLASTKNLIGDRELHLMKSGAVLIQASRGGIVDEAALARHVRSGHLGGAAVDVYTSEPPAPDHPLLEVRGEAARRLLLTPHVAGVTRQSAASLFAAAWRNVARVLVDGSAPLNRAY